MRITLKKCLITGIALLCLLFFFLAFVTTITVNYGPLLGLTVKSSILGLQSGKPFNPVYVYSIPVIAKDADSQTIQSVLDITNGTVGAMGTMMMVILIIDALAVVGSFFMPTPKGARGLTIPFLAITIIPAFVALAVVTALTNLKLNDFEFAKSNPSLQIIFLVVALVMFLALCIVPGVVKEKVFVGKKEEK